MKRTIKVTAKTQRSTSSLTISSANLKLLINSLLNNWPKYNKTRFTGNEIKTSISRLVKSKIINRELIGYSVSNEPQINKKIMPKYCY